MERARLIVKNFGPLKDIDIEVREMVCLIGKQASGKSTLAKLIAIFEDENFIKNTYSNHKNELKKYNIENFLSKNTYIKYENDFFNFVLSNLKLTKEFNLDKIEDKFLYTLKSKSNKYLILNNYWKELAKLKRKSIELFGMDNIKSKVLLDEILNYDSLYIPSERNFLHLISSNIQGLINNKIQIPEFLLNVGQEYEKALNNIKLVPLSLIDKKLKYKREGSTSYIYHSESEKVNLLESASGLQSVIPILLLIEFMNSNKKEYNYNFIIEEPELNLYPETQHNLIKHLVANCLDDITQSKNLVLTTHSPYVLSSINNLLMAYKKGQEKSKEVQKIIKKKSWLDPNRFAAYEMRNGKAYSIVNKRQGLIKENMIDSVVEIFDNEFTRLLNL